MDVGGYHIHLWSQGENRGNATVVLLGCGGCTSANWGWIQPEVARFTRVVAYDRAGFGWSDVGPAPPDAAHNARELRAALDAAHIPGPYVLVGHSYGGPVARLFAAQNPGAVVGMVLLDPRHPDMDARMPPEATAANAAEQREIALLGWMARFGLLRLTSIGRDQARSLPPAQAEEYVAAYNTAQFWESIQAQSAAIAATDAETRATERLGAIPLVVLSGDRAWLAPNAPADAARRVYTALNIEQAALSTNSAHRVVPGASHTSLVNNRQHAQAAIDAIREAGASDVFGLLFFILGINAVLVLPNRSAIVWIVLLYLIDSGSQLLSRGAAGVINVLFNIAVFALTYVFAYTVRQAELARRENEQLVDELRAAQRQLQDLAVTEERNRVVREVVRVFLATQPDLLVVGEADGGATGVALAAQLVPDVALLDLVMPGMDGVEATRQIKRASPRTQVVVLTSYHSDEHIFPALRAGALSYVLKDVGVDALADAIRKAAAGEAVLHTRVAARVIHELQGNAERAPNLFTELSERELDVLRLVAQGLTNADIAARLVLSDKTVKGHVSNILSKLHVADRTQAAVAAWREGWVSTAGMLFGALAGTAVAVGGLGNALGGGYAAWIALNGIVFAIAGAVGGAISGAYLRRS